MLPTIALFGGAFDPPHLGHTAIIINLLKRSEFDKIVIIPTGPRKDKNYHIPDILRKEMIQLWKETLSTSETEASRVVLDFDVFDGKVGEGTYEHEAYFQKKYTAREIFHVFGSDTISTMNEWEPHGDIVAQELLKIIFNRKGYPLDVSKIKNYTLLEGEIPEISSTEMRSGRDEFLHPTIKDFIKKNRLYTLL